jgi:DNA-binding NarL/FixJ family response regulator
MVLNLEPDLNVVAEAADGPAAVAMALKDGIDLAILDISMPRLTGLQVARQLKAHRPSLRVLLLSMHDSERYLLEALQAGASGYVLKSAADRDLVAACRAAMRGEPFITPAALSALVRERLDRVARGEDVPSNPLTPRETEVVKLVAEGHTSSEIAGILAISEKTVERHRANVLEKLELRDRVALTRYAIRSGLSEL